MREQDQGDQEQPVRALGERVAGPATVRDSTTRANSSRNSPAALSETWPPAETAQVNHSAPSAEKAVPVTVPVAEREQTATKSATPPT
ncbi:hypothetical protein SALBM311S_08775 [Streptomyces alboniger]